MLRIAFSLLAALTLVQPGAVLADVYKGVAANGTITLSNIYRPGMQRIASARAPAPVTRAQHPAPAQSAAGGSVAGHVARAAAAHGLPEALLHAVIQAESSYDPQARSPRGAAGLMQLMPETARELGVEDVWDPAANILGGARYLKRLLRAFDGQLPLALAAYNAGPAAVSRWGDAIPPYPETQRYVPRVLEHYRRLQEAAPSAH